jgi:hypothetical protein
LLSILKGNRERPWPQYGPVFSIVSVMCLGPGCMWKKERFDKYFSAALMMPDRPIARE